MNNLDSDMRVFIAHMARVKEIPSPLIEAMVMVESGGDIYAWNPEPRYRYLVNVNTYQPFRSLTPEENKSEIPPDDFPTLAGDRDAEWWGQQASWGPLQVMGAVAREYMFEQHFPALCSIGNGISFGVLHLAKLRDRYLHEHGWEGVVAAYNAGSPRYENSGNKFVNQSYVDKVREHGGFDFHQRRGD